MQGYQRASQPRDAECLAVLHPDCEGQDQADGSEKHEARPEDDAFGPGAHRRFPCLIQEYPPGGGCQEKTFPLTEILWGAILGYGPT